MVALESLLFQSAFLSQVAQETLAKLAALARSRKIYILNKAHFGAPFF
jgi:hypothetical protein